MGTLEKKGGKLGAGRTWVRETKPVGKEGCIGFLGLDCEKSVSDKAKGGGKGSRGWDGGKS